MKMIESRNLTSHTYNEDVAENIANKILNEYFPEFQMWQTRMEALMKEVS